VAAGPESAVAWCANDGAGAGARDMPAAFIVLRMRSTDARACAGASGRSARASSPKLAKRCARSFERQRAVTSSSSGDSSART
jgi:hypothetical protein